jgi:tetratricopeptide (TPR) repeat protein
MSARVAVVLALTLTASGLASATPSEPLEGRTGLRAAREGARQTDASPPPARVLVMPFDNVKREGRIFWLGEASAVLLADDLNALGVDAITREERRQAFERLQVPSAATLTDATIIRIGQLVGAARVIVGSLQLDGDTLVAHARSIALDTGRVQTNVSEAGPVPELFATFERIARKIAPPSSKTPAEIERLRPPVLAFEDFVKGLLAETPATSIGYLNAALKLHPGYDRARLALWDVYTDQSDHQQALAAVQPVTADSPWARRARFRGGLSQIALKKYDEAFTTFKALVDAQPTAAVLNNLGVVQSRRGGSPQTGRPADFFKKAADTDAGDPDYFFNLGYAHWGDRDAQAAIYWLREAVRRNAADGEAHYVLGCALALAGNSGEAAREKDLARRLSSTFEQWDKRPSADAVPKGLERLKTDVELPHASRLDQTVAATERRDQRDLAQFYLDRGRRLMQQEHDSDAIIELNHALYLSPYQPQAHLALGRIHLRAGRVRDAIDALKISLWSEETVEAHVVLAEAYLQAKNAAAARTEAERALSLDPSSADAKRLVEKAGPRP